MLGLSKCDADERGGWWGEYLAEDLDAPGRRRHNAGQHRKWPSLANLGTGPGPDLGTESLFVMLGLQHMLSLGRHFASRLAFEKEFAVGW